MKVSKIAITLCIAALVTISSCAKEKASSSDTPAHGDSGHVNGTNDSKHSATDGHKHDSSSVNNDSSKRHSVGDGHAH